MTVAKESEISKLQAEVGLLRHQVEVSGKKNKLFDQELSSLEKRIEAKNDYITKLEEQKCNLSEKIASLEDEIMSWKLHECREESEAAFDKAKTKRSKQTEEASKKTREGEHEDSEDSRDSQNATTEFEHNASQSQLTTADAFVKQSNGKGSIKDQRIGSEDPKKLKVQIVGTSNIKFISQEYIGEREFEVSKITKYTLDETYKYIEGLTLKDKHDIFILHSLCNDVGGKSPEECSNQMKRIIESITKKYADVKVIISLGLPRQNRDLNRKIEKMNIIIKEMISELENVYLCDNSNLFYKGEAQKGILNEDGLHLARSGTRKLGRNMKEALWGAFDIPIIIRFETNQKRQNNRVTPSKDSKLPNLPQYGSGETTPHDMRKVGSRQHSTSNVAWKGDRLWNGDRQSGSKDTEKRAYYSYDTQDRGRQQDNHDTREEVRQSHRNYDDCDRERRSYDNYGSREVERRSQNNSSPQKNRWWSHDNYATRGGIRRHHDYITWDTVRGNNDNRSKGERSRYSNQGTLDDEMGSYNRLNRDSTPDREWRSHHNTGAWGEGRRSHYYRDEDSNYGDWESWSQNRLFDDDLERWNYCDNSYGNYRY